MNKKYTVFLSSTYDDLREERREVIHALLELGCIPCGMEAFPADDDEQFEFIKLEKSEKGEQNGRKLHAFIEYVSKGKMVKFWNGKEDLAGKVSRPMVSIIKLHPSMGWVRGDSYMGIIPGTFAGKHLDLYENHVPILEIRQKNRPSFLINNSLLMQASKGT